MYLLGQTGVGVRVAVGTTDGHVVWDTVAWQSGVPVPGHGVYHRRFAVFFRASDLAGKAIARVAVHLERGSMVCNTEQTTVADSFKYIILL